MTTLRLEAVNTVAEIKTAMAEAGGKAITMQYGDFTFNSDNHCVFQTMGDEDYTDSMVIRQSIGEEDHYFIVKHCTMPSKNGRLIFTELVVPNKVILGDCEMHVSTNGKDFASVGDLYGEEQSLALDKRRNELLTRIATALENPKLPSLKVGS